MEIVVLTVSTSVRRVSPLPFLFSVCDEILIAETLIRLSYVINYLFEVPFTLSKKEQELQELR